MDELSINFDSLSLVKIPFQLKELKIEHFYFYDELEIGTPLSTSVLLKRHYTSSDTFDWEKIVSHQYVEFDQEMKSTMASYSVPISIDIISKLEEIDLRELKNNYFTERDPEQFSYWEVTYNHHFKIVGTYDQIVTEIKSVFSILDFQNIINQEAMKIRNTISEEFGGELS